MYGRVGFPETTFVDPAPISIPKLETFIFQHYHLLLVLPRSTLTVMPQRKQTKGVLAKSVLNLSLHGLLGGAQISRSIYVLKVHCLLLAQFRLLDNFLSLEKVSKKHGRCQVLFCWVFFFLTYLSVFGWGLHFFPISFFFKLFMYGFILVRNHSKVSVFVVQVFPLITENTSFPKL